MNPFCSCVFSGRKSSLDTYVENPKRMAERTFTGRHTISRVSDNIDCSKMLSIASVNVFEHLYVSLGVITYIDIAKGLKTAYRAFFHEDTHHRL